MVVILCGKSGSGKDAITSNMVQSDDFERLVSSTSRPMRDGEVNGREYNFLSREDFEEKLRNNRFIESRSYDTLVGGKPDTWYYGTEKFNRSDIFRVAIKDLDGALKLKDYCESIGEPVRAILISCPDEIRKERAVKRGSFDETEWNRRLKTDEKDFSEDKIRKVIDYELVNDGKFLPGGLSAHLQRYVRSECRKDKQMELYEEIENER